MLIPDTAAWHRKHAKLSKLFLLGWLVGFLFKHFRRFLCMSWIFWVFVDSSEQGNFRA